MTTVVGDHLQFSTIALEVQGSLLAVANGYDRCPRRVPAHRGSVGEFSSASRKRMLRKSARLSPSQGIFLTLTYPARYPDPRTAKNHLRALLERFRRRYPNASGLWRLEAQERGAPHFHLLMFDLPFVPFWTLKHWWAEIVADYVDATLPFVRIEYCDNVRKVSRYIAKYCAKVEPGKSFFNNGSYLHAGPGPGRYWGVFAGHNLPFARSYYVTFETIDPTGLRDILEVFTLAWPGVDPTWPHGVQVFAEDAYRLFQLALAAGLACKTHGTDVLCQGQPPTVAGAILHGSSAQRPDKLRVRECGGVVSPARRARHTLGPLLQRHLSRDVPMGVQPNVRANGLRRRKAHALPPQGVGGSDGFVRGLIRWGSVDLV